MNYQEALAALGLPVDATLPAARRAYAQLLKVHRPEQDPAGFMQIQAAWELVRLGPATGPIDGQAESEDQPSDQAANPAAIVELNPELELTLTAYLAAIDQGQAELISQQFQTFDRLVSAQISQGAASSLTILLYRIVSEFQEIYTEFDPAVLRQFGTAIAWLAGGAEDSPKPSLGPLVFTNWQARLLRGRAVHFLSLIGPLLVVPEADRQAQAEARRRLLRERPWIRRHGLVTFLITGVVFVIGLIIVSWRPVVYDRAANERQLQGLNGFNNDEQIQKILRLYKELSASPSPGRP